MGLQDAVKAYVQVEPAGSYDQVGYQVVSGNAVIVSQDGYITAVREGKAVVRAYSLRTRKCLTKPPSRCAPNRTWSGLSLCS